MSDQFTLHEIVGKLIGPVEPQGDSYLDASRFDNLSVMTGLVDKLLFEINGVAQGTSSDLHSVKKAADHAFEFLDEVRSQT